MAFVYKLKPVYLCYRSVIAILASSDAGKVALDDPGLVREIQSVMRKYPDCGELQGASVRCAAQHSLIGSCLLCFELSFHTFTIGTQTTATVFI